MGYIPWNNPDNIVSKEVASISRVIKVNIIVFLCLIGGPANVINMAVFYKQGLKDRINLCLFALSFSDELYLIMLLLFNGDHFCSQFTSQKMYGPLVIFMTKTHLTGFLGVYLISTVLSAIIATERCCCVLRPLKFQTLMRTRTMASIIVVGYILVLGLFFLASDRYELGCVHDPEAGVLLKATMTGGIFYRTHKQFIDSLHGVILGAVLPGILMLVVITSTIITTVKLRQIVTRRAGTSSSVSHREVALTKMLVGNSILFIICVSPVALIRLSWLIFPEINSGRRYHNFYLTCLCVLQVCNSLNATANIFVYYAMGSRYRETFWSLCNRRAKPAQSREKLDSAFTTT